jgi:hypothetical protein
VVDGREKERAKGMNKWQRLAAATITTTAVAATTTYVPHGREGRAIGTGVLTARVRVLARKS